MTETTEPGTAEAEAVPETSAPSVSAADAPADSVRPARSNAPHRFDVQADTLTAVARKREKQPVTTPAATRTPAPQRFYTVQVGAFRLRGNADRNEQLLRKHFSQPVIRFSSERLKMERLCIGHFTSFREATAFMAAVKGKFPKEFGQAWIAELVR